MSCMYSPSTEQAACNYNLTYTHVHMSSFITKPHTILCMHAYARPNLHLAQACTSRSCNLINRNLHSIVEETTYTLACTHMHVHPSLHCSGAYITILVSAVGMQDTPSHAPLIITLNCLWVLYTIRSKLMIRYIWFQISASLARVEGREAAASINHN